MVEAEEELLRRRRLRRGSKSMSRKGIGSYEDVSIRPEVEELDVVEEEGRRKVERPVLGELSRPSSGEDKGGGNRSYLRITKYQPR